MNLYLSAKRRHSYMHKTIYFREYYMGKYISIQIKIDKKATKEND